MLHGGPSIFQHSYRQQGPFNPLAGQFMHFRTIGHTAIGVIFGVAGGFIARRFALQLALADKRVNDAKEA